ncbi:hypothetical protein PHYSODRAFT_342424 [Phytophthora sojae]|uniref:Uncharacterized protein n=1 Tax=Phytophthora sojae (strain P6497) TaxID=1094619 RepID=G5AGC7_PHYSP|nr:hypothetical protein PHYSODRAFT_342424 [Phytophthora sojae]EGZ05639.1 hypothetical protein PHYSODRAFT_342424 [Phytophthora sojae]|eukprot:XP_009539170.1 hypothetical protein PHYSODRAFT_342424 [Phytophthora sojae]
MRVATSSRGGGGSQRGAGMAPRRAATRSATRALATALLEDDPYELAERRQSNRRTNLYDSDSDRSDKSQLSYSDSPVDSYDDYIGTGLTSDHVLEDTIGATKLGDAVTPVNACRTDLVPPAAERTTPFTTAAVACELFQRCEKLAAFVKSNVDKTKLSDDLQGLYTPITYEFEEWILDHHAGVELILGTDLIIPPGIRLDLYDSVMAYEGAMDQDRLQREQQSYAEWLARQQSAVDRRNYPEPSDYVAD